MEYYKLLNLSREPFSNSPDPEMFFRSSRHAQCLQKLEIAIRLRRGLSIVCGEVGTGKTTVCRHLIRSMSGDDSLEIHMVLDPSFEGELEMLAVLNAMFNGKDLADACSSATRHKESIKNYLFRKGVDEHKTIVLVVDEGQKLSSAGVEILRELLNFETNDQKLLQIIIFAQNEMDQILERHPNFADRVGLYHRLLPLTEKDTGQFIRYRLERAGTLDEGRSGIVFTKRALREIQSMTGGYPRKIINLSHNILLNLIIMGTHKVTPSVVHKAARNLPSLSLARSMKRPVWAAGAAAVAVLAVWTVLSLLPGTHFPREEPPPAGTGPALGQSAVDREENLLAQIRESGAESFEKEPVNPGVDMAEIKDIPDKQGEIEPVPVPAVQAVHEEQQAGKTVSTGLPGMPDRLGAVRVNSNENLWKMVERIYGACNERLIQQVAGQNPGLNNVDIIYREQEIDFPVISLRQPADNEMFWVKHYTSGDLDEAYQFVFTRLDDFLRVLVLWREQEGFEFAVVRGTSFRTWNDADQATMVPAGDQTGKAEILALDRDVLLINES